ncbi:glycyl-tRNA synthetase beta chain [Thermovirga lienii DSM 17291]|uniref:Glycine--tRNA ligase beta subunit n=1 Tax=Thermovirga lienii (strain ATCC BAA-1197 / DSM 17291 / Cas60314) TaxID=580340 RepID=G7V9G6_THELD|nr:glycine--tRNA ligase subunit beta [Thermovirga lienii]AER66516.1 glycyl-tRNA synthetase beta chain [Thermovirga lienii DSM 17291]KUK42953.1 MAG: Glycine--tRNA ligase beta subunit [Thermovirga lienii]MDN5318692.1 glycyl-tRNA synthetase beta chain [Thermovirga sp.]MDN5367434.1 glycyl-tRNA synthetase beta chain [Thermovirga sp.]
MDKKDFLFEIGTEEIPARFVSWAVKEIEEIAKSEFDAARLSYECIQGFATPRRLTIFVRDLKERQEDFVEAFKGPAWEQAFDAYGNPTKAAKGFAKSKGVDVESLEKREVGGGYFAFAVKKIEGKNVRDILPEVLEKIIKRLVFPKNMYWDSSMIRFARPIRWIVSLYGEEVVPFSYGNVQAGRKTAGHRFMGAKSFELDKVEDYFPKLYENYVIVDPQKRREKMLMGLAVLEKEINGKAQLDEELVEENLYLVEYPVPFVGTFDENFLEMPEEVLVTTMKHHQRYFPVRDSSGKLKPYFIGVSNNRATNMANVREGNERVLRARLSDAAFFWKEDLKVPLKNRVEGLKNIVYQEKLGSVYDKTMKVKELAAHICDLLDLGDEKPLVERAAYLSKADLLTNMVYEFPELRGVMGREYAKKSGEHERVALALYEQYLPAYVGDSLPTDIVGAVVGLAERLDTIVGGFKVGLQPTGSQDPYGLRRAARGINELIWGLNLDLDIAQVVRASGCLHEMGEEKIDEVLDFLRQRLLFQLKEKGFAHELVELALDVTWANPLQAYRFAEAFSRVTGEEWFKGLVTSAVRVNNILEKAHTVPEAPNESLFVDVQEKELYEGVKSIKGKVAKAVEQKEWEELTKILSQLEPYVSAFFDNVLVMSEDEKVRANRLALLKETKGLFSTVGDLSRLKG